MSSRSGLYPREAFHRLASPQTSFGVRSSRIHFSPTDGFSYERVAQFDLEWIFSNLDSGFQSLVGFRILSAGFRIPKPRIPDSTSKKFLDSGIRIPLHGAIRRNCWKGRCTSSGFARSISCLCCLFSTTRLHRSLDTCFHTKFSSQG